jgi:hypothetical protein
MAAGSSDQAVGIPQLNDRQRINDYLAQKAARD